MNPTVHERPLSGPASLPWLEEAYLGQCFTADVHPPSGLHAAFVRAKHAHAEILSVTSDHLDSREVVGFWTAKDLPDTLAPIPCIIPITNRDGSARTDPPRTLMASSRCRHEGEIIAMVVATSQRAARRAAKQVHVEYRPLVAVDDASEAVRADGPRIWDDAKGNVCFDWEMGNAARRDEAFRSAAHVVQLKLRNNRVVIAPIEPRSAIGTYIEHSDSYLLITPTQGANWVRDVIARDVLGWDPRRLDVLTPLVGGSFGAKIFVYPEQVLVLLAAEWLKASVKWSGTRYESFVADVHGRDNHTEASLALDAQGRFIAIATDTIANLGAHLSNYAPFSSTTCGAPLLCGIYQFEQVYARVRGVFTNTAPIDSYRGAGRPEAHYVLERLIDVAASQLGIDPAELRLRNAIDETKLPYTTATGIHIDSGMFRQNILRAMKAADYTGFGARRAVSVARGLMRGIGMANFLETNGGFALAKLMEKDTGQLPRETARILVAPSGLIQVDVGTQSSGQDHRGAYARILADYLAVPLDHIKVHQGRSDRLRHGTGTGGSKSMLSGSAAILEAADALIVQARRWLAESAGCPVSDIVWDERRLRLDDTALSFLELVRMMDASAPGETPFDVEVTATILAGTYANGCHVCEVEVDPSTGLTRVVRYTAVCDFGKVISVSDVLAQQHGGIVQGIGQALIESCRYGADGRMSTAGLASYHLPQAGDIPELQIVLQENLTLKNRLGLKGCGEAGASAAPPAVINALNHALGSRVLHPVQMPATPETVWMALNGGGAA